MMGRFRHSLVVRSLMIRATLASFVAFLSFTAAQFEKSALETSASRIGLRLGGIMVWGLEGRSCWKVWWLRATCRVLALPAAAAA